MEPGLCVHHFPDKSQSGGGHTATKSSSALTGGANLVARVSASQLHSGQFIIWTVALVAWEVQELEELAQGSQILGNGRSTVF